MLDLGRHAAFVWASYGAFAVVTVGLVAWLMLAGRHWRRELAGLEVRGARRRSATGSGATARPPADGGSGA